MAERLNGGQFVDFVTSSKLPVLADFYRDGCIPCRRVSPLLSRAETAYEGKIAVIRVNLTQNPDLAEQYQIEAAPTLLLFQAGQEVNRHRGVIGRDELNDFIESVFV